MELGEDFGEQRETWTSFRLDDDASFVDVVTTDASGTFSRLRSWAAYRDTLDDRCDRPPVISQLREHATYASPA